MNYFRKTIIVFTSALILSTQMGYSNEGSYLDEQTFMTLSEAKHKWGARPFTAKAFKEGSTRQRAEMAVKLIERKHFVGKTRGQVQDELGPFSGRFWSHTVPTYMIEEGWTKGVNSWQLVFLLDDDGKVSEVRIHKNCCSGAEKK